MESMEYGKVYNVETNVKVKNVGTLDEDSKDILLRYYKRIFVGADPDPASVTPRPGDAVLVGVGAALHALAAPITPGTYASATTGSEFVSASTVSGYPPSSTMLGVPYQVGAHAGPSSYYPPGSQYERPSSATYYPTSSTYGMNSALDPGPSSYNLPSMHSQTQYPSSQMASSSRGLTYNSGNMMDSSRRSSTAYYPASNRDSYPYQPQSSTAFQSNDPGYSSGYYQPPPSNYPHTSAQNELYSQSGDGFGQDAEQYPPQGGYSNRLPYSGPALPSAYEDDIELSVDPAQEAALAKKRRDSSYSGRRRPPGR
ncbi:hypothetical protein NA56DRAFT_134360 [Hyaloscypha hepaticicola]|uniref:Uncharacterized protein n=1 Tax=Hyaloscypha hepaticicola TaxID=2082293 RepID=A0A2J6Q4H6_9HELO|nr:hypothetical protein NA56DRAFT_134360 [Hyaloscypha hepaticicola]